MRVTSWRLLCLALSAYAVNYYYGFFPTYLVGAYSFAGGAIVLWYECGWRESLAFVFCYGTFLALQSATTVVGWLLALVRPLRWCYHVCLWLVGSHPILQGPVPSHGG